MENERPVRTLAAHLLRGLLFLGILSCGRSHPALPQADCIGSWKLESTNGILHNEYSETILTLRANGTYEMTYAFNAPGRSPVYGSGGGIYTVEKDEITFLSPVQIGVSQDIPKSTGIFSVEEDRLTLIIDGNTRIYRKEG